MQPLPRQESTGWIARRPGHTHVSETPLSHAHTAESEEADEAARMEATREVSRAS